MLNKSTHIVLSVVVMVVLSSRLFSQSNQDELKKLNHKHFDMVTHKMDIIPGMWRPMFENEQVAWISPPWESQEYVWFDFPEAIWIEGNLAYLGHIDRRFPTLFPTVKSAPWQKIENGISYHQELPNGINFGGEIVKKQANIAALKLWITNRSDEELKEVMLQTCVFLNSLKEFNKKTNHNKYIHIPNKGWMPFPETVELDHVPGGIRVGWPKEGKQVSDLPVIIVKSKTKGRFLSLTWFDDTNSFIGNPNHPCVHADPVFKDLKPGESQTIFGELIFFEGTMKEFDRLLRERLNIVNENEYERY